MLILSVLLLSRRCSRNHNYYNFQQICAVNEVFSAFYKLVKGNGSKFINSVSYIFRYLEFYEVVQEVHGDKESFTLSMVDSIDLKGYL